MLVEATTGDPAGADRDEADAETLAAALKEQRAITEKIVWQSFEAQAAGSRRQAAVERLERRLRDAADAALAGKEMLREAMLAAERLRGDLAAAETRIAMLEGEKARTEAAGLRIGAAMEDRAGKLAMLQERLTAMMSEKASRAGNLERQIKINQQLDARIVEAEQKTADLGATLRERQADLARQNAMVALLTSNLAVARATSDMMIVRARMVDTENRRLSLRADQAGRELEFRRHQIAMRDAQERDRLARPTFGSWLAGWWQRITSATPRLDPRLAAAGVTDEDVEAIRTSGLFDPEWYAWRYPDRDPLEDGVVDLLTRDGTPRNPGPLFDAVAYRADAGEGAQNIHPLLHYVLEGRAAGVPIRPLTGDVTDNDAAAHPMIDHDPSIGSDNEVLARHPLFDAFWYLAVHADVAAAGLDPVTHYLEAGAAEGRNPGPYFNTSAYTARYHDVFESGMNPLLHFIRFGMHEGRLIQPAAVPLYSGD